MDPVQQTHLEFARNTRMNIILLLIIAVVCPPLAVYLDWGCTYHLAVNIFLCSFAWVFGIFHAWVMVTAYSVLSCRDYIMSLMEEKKEIVIEQPVDLRATAGMHCVVCRHQMGIEQERLAYYGTMNMNKTVG
ncbi:hypothetical protein GCK32_007786 [Trichostrongylus colubriformis]|uniref:Uncharacterized protein n=1 Tax=Trichostrongylus colubriformis TaxID=6319 RepID=A0AAN8FIN6_TRICO